MKIGVVGFSRNDFDLEQAKTVLLRFIRKITAERNPKEVELVSGLTDTGVPRLAYLIADEMGLVTVGFTAKAAFQAKYGLYPVQKEIIFGEFFGDESEEFVKYIDYLIRVGGGKQSLREVELFKEKYSPQELSQRLFEWELS